MKPLRIHVIDEDLPLAETLARGLQASGFEASAHGSGHESLEQTRLSPPDLVFLSVTLPGEDAVELWFLFRETAGLSRLRFALMLPERGAYPDRYLGLEGIVDMVRKPLSVEEAVRLTRLAVSEELSPLQDRKELQATKGARQLSLLEGLVERTVDRQERGVHPESESSSAEHATGHVEAGPAVPVPDSVSQATDIHPFDPDSDSEDPAERLESDLRRSVSLARRNRVIAAVAVSILLVALVVFLRAGGKDEPRSPSTTADVKTPSTETSTTQEERQLPAASPDDPEEDIAPVESTTPSLRDGTPPPIPPAQDTSASGEESASEEAASTQTGGYSIQVGAFLSESNSDRLADTFRAKGFKAEVVASFTEDGSLFHRVLLGRYRSRTEANRAMARLGSEGIKGYVVSRSNE